MYVQEETYDVKYKMFEFVGAKCYDHVWVAGLALNCTEAYLKETGMLNDLCIVGCIVILN